MHHGGSYAHITARKRRQSMTTHECAPDELMVTTYYLRGLISPVTRAETDPRPMYVRPRRRLEGQGYWYPRLLEHVTWLGLGLGSG